MERRGIAVTALGVAVAAGGLGTGLGLSLAGGHATGTATLRGASAAGNYSYYQAVAKRYAGDYGPGGGMMGGRSMMAFGSGVAGTGSPGGDFPGYGWMMGGSGAPGWMTGGSLPSYMMGGSTDMGQAMGRVWADAPGPRVSADQAQALGTQVPTGASVDKAANTVTFTASDVSFAALASPSMPAENFEVAGLTDPEIVVPLGAHVNVQLVNADDDMAHGFVVSAQGAQGSVMPMMTAAPAFSGAALWFLGEATSAGMHTGTASFTASDAGTYTYFCPVPGHAQEGMQGSFVVKAAPDRSG